MCMYNMFSAELKTLNNYFNNILIKKWICEFQNFVNMFILFVLRKNDELHLCVDYYELNIIIIKNCYFLSLINKLLDWLNNSTIFSKINLWNAYYKICICKDDEWKTAFHIYYRYFEYQIVLFDLINALIIFQVYINCVLCDLVDDFCIVYLDNILIFFKTEEKHYQYLELVIKCLQCAELYMNFKKCKFFKSEMKYLDFLVNKNDFHMNSSCVKTVFDWHNHLFKIFHNI